MTNNSILPSEIRFALDMKRQGNPVDRLADWELQRLNGLPDSLQADWAIMRCKRRREKGKSSPKNWSTGSTEIHIQSLRDSSRALKHAGLPCDRLVHFCSVDAYVAIWDQAKPFGWSGPNLSRILRSIRTISNVECGKAAPGLSLRISALNKVPRRDLWDNVVKSQRFIDAAVAANKRAWEMRSENDPLAAKKAMEAAILAVQTQSTLRLKELTLLRLSNVDLEATTPRILVPKSIRKAGDCLRILLNQPHIAQIVRDYVYVFRPTLINEDLPPEDALFLNKDGRPIKRHSVSAALAGLVFEYVGVRASATTFRRSAASEAKTEAQREKQLGHSKTSSLGSSTYRKPQPLESSDTARRLLRQRAQRAIS
jgi:hypothetical protein